MRRFFFPETYDRIKSVIELKLEDMYGFEPLSSESGYFIEPLSPEPVLQDSRRYIKIPTTEINCEVQLQPWEHPTYSRMYNGFLVVVDDDETFFCAYYLSGYLDTKPSEQMSKFIVDQMYRSRQIDGRCKELVSTYLKECDRKQFMYLIVTENSCMLQDLKLHIETSLLDTKNNPRNPICCLKIPADKVSAHLPSEGVKIEGFLCDYEDENFVKETDTVYVTGFLMKNMGDDYTLEIRSAHKSSIYISVFNPECKRLD